MFLFCSSRKSNLSSEMGRLNHRKQGVFGGKWILAERGGFEPPVLFRYSRFPGVRLKPLSHLSKTKRLYSAGVGSSSQPLFGQERARQGSPCAARTNSGNGFIERCFSSKFNFRFGVELLRPIRLWPLLCPVQKESAQFEGILDRYFEAMLEEHPIAATVAGLKSGEGKLGKISEPFLEKQEKRRQNTLRELDRVSPGSLTGDQHLDRLALRSMLLQESEDHSRRRHKLDPSAVETVLNILLHELIRGEDEPKRAGSNLRSLLKQAPGYFEQAAELLDRPEPVWRKIMAQTAEGARSLFQAVENFLKNNAPEAADAQLLSEARAALKKYTERAMDRPEAAAGSFAVGTAILARRVQDELGLDYSLGEIEALAADEAVRLGSALERECRKFGKNRKAEEIMAEARSNWDPGPDLLALYQSETERIRQAFESAMAVSFPPGETLEVRPAPEFMRNLFPTAAYTSPGPFEKRQRGIFWVNDLSVVKKREEEKKAERAQHFGLSLTCAHEAYPGHHLQFTTANRHRRKWRRLFAHAVFYEGWTLWCEQMMVDLKIDRSPWLKVQQLHDALWRCHRILVDLRLQTGGCQYQQAVRHMMKHLGFTKARAEADVNWYTTKPGVPMSYWLGRLENERLRRRLVGRRGWSLQQFNDWLLSFGTLPQAWLEKYCLD
jgi:uncharacterized protein (DUF885 family)